MSSKGPLNDKKISENFLKTALRDFDRNISKMNELSAQSQNYSKEIQLVQSKNDNIIKHLRDLMVHPDASIKQQANDVLVKVMSKQLQTKAFAMPLPTIPTAPARPSTPVPMPALPNLPNAQPAAITQPQIEPAKQSPPAQQNQKSEKKSLFKKITSQFKKSLEDYGNSPENTTKRVSIMLKKSSGSVSLKSKKTELDKLYGIQPGEKTHSVMDKILDHFNQPRAQVLQKVEMQLKAKMVELSKNVVEGKMTLNDANVELKKAAEVIINNFKEEIKEAIKKDRGANLAIMEYAILNGVMSGKVNKKSAMEKIKTAQDEHSNYSADSEKGNFNVFRSSVGMGMLEEKLAAEIKKQSPQQPLSASLPPVIDVPVTGNGQGFLLDIPDENAAPNNNQASVADSIQKDNPRTLLFRPPPPSTPPPAKEEKAEAETRTTPKYK